MISLIQILYGSRVRRQGRSRLWRAYQRGSARRKALTTAGVRFNRCGMVERTSYTCPLPADKLPQLKRDLREKGYDFRDVPYAHFGATSDGEKVNLTAYTSGKLVIQ